jgi:hypothetical protein
MMTLTTEWTAYDHNYQKEVQDIKTRTGVVYEGCWPNAGKWNVLDGSGRTIPDQWVEQVRLTHTQIWD